MIPGVVLAGTNSGCGKTTVTIALLNLMTKNGVKVQPFKVGPDYIDPMYHTKVTGRHSRNLDSFMLEKNTLRYLYKKNSKDADIAIIEGVMGLFDGLGGTTSVASTSEVAKILDAPVILIINGEGMSYSSLAMINGFINFDTKLKVRGVIFNKIKSRSHYEILKSIVEENTNVLSLGYVPYLEEASLKSRHLGLLPQEEVKDLDDKIDRLSEIIKETLNIEKILLIAKESLTSKFEIPNIEIEKKFVGINIGIAYDKAFNFYYQDNLELLEEMGARLIRFSPLNDEKLTNLDGIILGGGYPEVFSNELSENKVFKECLREKVLKGIPVYAECGGMMYLMNKLIDKDSKEFDFVGVIPATVRMTDRLQKFGYVKVESLSENFMLSKGETVNGHEFHYSEDDFNVLEKKAYMVRKASNLSKSWTGGISHNNILAGYPHLHFWSNPKMVEKFLNHCLKWRRENE